MLFERIIRGGIELSQHKEPALSRNIIMLDGIEFKDFDLNEYRDIDPETVYKIIQLSKIRDEHTGEYLIDIINRALLKETDLLLLNAVDDDPYTSSSYSAMTRLSKYAVLGLNLVGKILKPKKRRCVINHNLDDDGIDSKIPEKIFGLKVKRVNMTYPISPRLNRYYDGNTVAIGACALVNLAKAIIDGEISRICFVTVAGDAVGYSCNIACKIGTPLSELLQEVSPQRYQKMILGSVMSGRAIESTDVGVEENTKSVILMKKYSVRTDLNCIGCGRCVSACPQRISPYYIYKSSKRGYNDEYLMTLSKLCTECGCCSYVCPGKCNPAHYIKLYKRRAELNEKKGGDTLETDTNRV